MSSRIWSAIHARTASTHLVYTNGFIAAAKAPVSYASSRGAELEFREGLARCFMLARKFLLLRYSSDIS